MSGNFTITLKKDTILHVLRNEGQKSFFKGTNFFLLEGTPVVLGPEEECGERKARPLLISNRIGIQGKLLVLTEDLPKA